MTRISWRELRRTASDLHDFCKEYHLKQHGPVELILHGSRADVGQRRLKAAEAISFLFGVYEQLDPIKFTVKIPEEDKDVLRRAKTARLQEYLHIDTY